MRVEFVFFFVAHDSHEPRCQLDSRFSLRKPAGLVCRNTYSICTYKTGIDRENQRARARIELQFANCKLRAPRRITGEPNKQPADQQKTKTKPVAPHTLTCITNKHKTLLMLRNIRESRIVNRYRHKTSLTTSILSDFSTRIRPF